MLNNGNKYGKLEQTKVCTYELVDALNFKTLCRHAGYDIICCCFLLIFLCLFILLVRDHMFENILSKNIIRELLGITICSSVK